MGFSALVVSLSCLSISLSTALVCAQEVPWPNDLKKLRAVSSASSVATAHGLVTCVQESLFYLQDDTDAFLVFKRDARQAVEPGDVIELTCERHGMGGGQVLSALEIKKLGTRDLAAPVTTIVDQVVSGVHLHRRVRVKGSVHDVAFGVDRLLLLVDDNLSSVSVSIPFDTSQRRPDELLDAVVEVTGIAQMGTRFDQSDRRWSIMPVNSIEDVKVLQPGNADPFSLPLRSLADVRKSPAEEWGRRIRVVATVTYASHSGWFYVQDEQGFTARARKPDLYPLPSSLRRPFDADTELYPGDVVVLTGQPAPKSSASPSMPWLVQCEWRKVGHKAPPHYQKLDMEEVLMGDFDGKPVSMAGRVSGISVSDDSNGYVNHYLNFGNFTALVQLKHRADLPVKEGEAARINGVIKAVVGADGRTANARINVQSLEDMHRIPFAVERGVFYKWVSGVGIAVSASVLWIVMLRRQVRRQTLALLAANEDLARFKQIADTTTDLVAMTSLDRRPFYMNPAGRRMIGLGLEEDISQIDFNNYYTPESMELFEREGFAHAFKHGHWTGEVIMRHRDGHEIPVVLSGLVLSKPDGSPLCMSCVAHDISQRLSLEKQLRSSLDHERELNRLRSNFVNTISHEFRTPLGIILFASSMLRRFDQTFSPAEKHSQLDVIDESVRRMNELVEQALSLGRAEVAVPGKARVDMREFCLRVIGEVMAATSRRSPITLLQEADLPVVECDETLLRIILANLLGNAVKYSPAGSPVCLKLAKLGTNSISIEVRDHGPGLHDEDLPNLFTVFHRGKGVEGIPGTGLGLAIVKRCADSLGGTVTARNLPEGGAVFTVVLPLHPEQS